MRSTPPYLAPKGASKKWHRSHWHRTILYITGGAGHCLVNLKVNTGQRRYCKMTPIGRFLRLTENLLFPRWCDRSQEAQQPTFLIAAPMRLWQNSRSLYHLCFQCNQVIKFSGPKFLSQLLVLPMRPSNERHLAQFLELSLFITCASNATKQQNSLQFSKFLSSRLGWD